MSAGKAPALGDVVEIRCRYCRLNLDANVSSLGPDGAIAKVQCRTCRHFQDFKAPVPVEEQRAKLIRKAMKLAEKHTQGAGGTHHAPATRTTGSLSAEAVARALWQEATKDANPMRSKPYDPHRSYLLDDLIAHKTLGLGVVREVSDDGLLILFRDGFQRLPHEVPREE
jgi:hypothetical protein